MEIGAVEKEYSTHFFRDRANERSRSSEVSAGREPYRCVFVCVDSGKRTQMLKHLRPSREEVVKYINCPSDTVGMSNK